MRIVYKFGLLGVLESFFNFDLVVICWCCFFWVVFLMFYFLVWVCVVVMGDVILFVFNGVNGSNGFVYINGINGINVDGVVKMVLW